VELLLSEMTTAGIAIDSSFLCVLLLAYGSAKPQQRERAETFVRTSAAAGISMDDQKLAAALSHVLGRSAADALLGELQDDAMFAAYAKEFNVDGAVRILWQMQQKGIRPNTVAYSALARLFAHRGAWEEVRNAVASGILVNDEKLAAVLSHVLGRSAAVAFLCDLTGFMTPSEAPGVMSASAAPFLMRPPEAPSSIAAGLMPPSGEPGSCPEVPAPSSLEPKQLLGEWLDSLGNAVQVYSKDASEAKLMATISRPPRADAHIPLRQLEGGWQCGNSFLINAASSECELHWVGAFGRISIWRRAHGNPESSCS